MNPNSCCANCELRRDIWEYDFSLGGCIQTICNGFACLAHAEEGRVIHMLGRDAEHNLCDNFKEIDDET